MPKTMCLTMSLTMSYALIMSMALTVYVHDHIHPQLPGDVPVEGSLQAGGPGSVLPTPPPPLPDPAEGRLPARHCPGSIIHFNTQQSSTHIIQLVTI